MELLNTPVTLALIIANIIVSAQGFKNQRFFNQYAFWIEPIRTSNEWVRMFTSGFLHVNGMHLFINMYVLYVFGTTVETIFGSMGFLILYVGSILGGSVWAYMDEKDNPNYRAVGASGATSGVLLAYCLFFPMQTLLLFFVLPMPAFVLAILFIGGSYYFSKKPNTMIGHGAHLGGAIAGLVLAVLLRPDAIQIFKLQMGF